MSVIFLLFVLSKVLLQFLPPVRSSESSNGIKPWQRNSTHAFSEEALHNLTYEEMATALRQRGYRVAEFPGEPPLVLVGSAAYLPEQVLPELAEGRSSGMATKTKNKWIKDGVAHVNYYFVPRTQANTTMFKEALKTWADNSCITFTELGSRMCTKALKDAICVGNFSGGCFSQLGKVDKEHWPQRISLDPDYCDKWGVTNDVGRVLGLNYQHSRPDRDTYVTTKFENLPPPHDTSNKSMEDLKSDWQLVGKCDEDQVVDIPVPYDYMSVMHLQSMAAVGSNLPMFVTKDGKYQYMLDYKHDAGMTQSHYDFYVVNTFYDCGKKLCPGTQPKCKHFGYLGKDCKCKCPKAFKGPTCQETAGSIFPVLKKAKVLLDVNKSQTIDMENYEFATEKLDGVVETFKHFQYFTVVADGDNDTQVSIDIQQSVDKCPKVLHATTQKLASFLNRMYVNDCFIGITVMWGLSSKGQLRVECMSSMANNELHGPMLRGRTNHLDLIYRSSIGMAFVDPMVTIQLMQLKLKVAFSPRPLRKLTVQEVDAGNGTGNGTGNGMGNSTGNGTGNGTDDSSSDSDSVDSVGSVAEAAKLMANIGIGVTAAVIGLLLLAGVGTAFFVCRNRRSQLDPDVLLDTMDDAPGSGSGSDHDSTSSGDSSSGTDDD